MSLFPVWRSRRRATSVFVAALLAAATLALVAWQWPSATPPPRPKRVNRQRDHERARAQWFLRDRRALDGRLPAAHLLRAFQQKRLISHVYPRPWSAAFRRELFGSRRLAAPQPTVGNWTELGPSPQTGMDFIQVSGRITTLAVDLADDPTGNTVYLGAAYGGIWQSTNALSTSTTAPPAWTPISDDTPSLAIGAIALLPGTNPPVVIAGTGEQNNSLDSYYGIGFERGVYDSTTNAWNWTAITSATSACGGCAGTTNGQSIPLLGLAFAKILVVPGTDTVLAAGGSSADINSISLVNQYYRGIYRSTDGGQTWSYVYTQGDANGTNYSCTDLVYDAKNGYVYAALRGHGIYQSTDAGATWTAVATPTPFVNPAAANLDQEFHRASLAVDSNGDLFTMVTDINGELATPAACGTGGAACDTGIWESPDGGKTWNPIASPTCGNLDATYTQTCSTADPLFNADNQGEYDMYIAVPPPSNPPASSETVVVGGIDVWSATPNGMSTTWTNLSQAYGPGIVHPDQHAIAFVNANTWFVGNDGGIWSTTNAGDPGAAGSTSAWTDLNNGIGTIQLISATPDPSQPGVYTGGSQDNGTVISTASTGTIWGLGWGGDGGNTAIDPADPKNYFSENSYVPTPPPSCGAPGPNCPGPNPIIVASTNGGKPTNYTGTGSSSYPPCGWPGNGNFTNDINVLANCVPSYAPILDTNLLAENGDFYLPFKLIPNNTSTMLLATCRLWMGPDLPAQADQGWAPISPDLTSDNAPAGACGADYVQDFAISSNSSIDIWAVTTDGQIQRALQPYSSPPNWTNATMSPLPINGSLPFGAVAVGPTSLNDAAGEVYLGVQGFTEGTNYGHVYQSENCNCWTDITGNLPDAPVNAIAIDPEIPNDVYIGTDVGVFVATDGGVSGEVWQQMGSGLPASAVLSLKIDDATRTLIAGTHGRGAWAIPLLGTPQPDFTLTTPSAILYSAPSAGTVQFTVNTVAQAGFSQPITVNCAGCSAVTVNPGAPAVMTATINTSAAETISVIGVSGSIQHSLSVQSLPTGFTLNATPSDPVVAAGQTATLTASVSPQGPFTGTVALSCLGQGDGITCAISPASVQIANGAAATATVTITTTARGALPPLVPDGNGNPWLWVLLAALALALAAAAVAASRRGRRLRLAYWLAPVVLAGFLILAACGGNSAGLPPTSGGGGGGGGGGGSTAGTPAGAYSITVQATSGSQTQTFPIILTVN